jgi:ubiquinone/menaquinone biosynthesis C-methylase UbiE
MRDEAAEASRTAFNAAADHYDDEPLSFHVRFGGRAVEHAQLRRGDRVLDVACGSGSSVLPAAQDVGPSGRVVGVDVSDGLLALCRAKVERAGFDNVELLVRDMRELDLPARSFDAVLLVFGLFMVPDMPALVRDLWELVKPGGRLVITVWARGLLEPAYSAFFDAVGARAPDLVPRDPGWLHVADPSDLRSALAAGGVPDDAIEIVSEPAVQELRNAEEFWTIVMGSGMRGTLDRLPTADREPVRRQVLDIIEANGITQLPVDVHYARATRSV